MSLLEALQPISCYTFSQTFPTSAFELVPFLNEDDVKLVLAHTVEFAIDRIKRFGVTAR